jgi:septal ring factor EnvC (AmiA/AmiB activator)
MKPSHIFILVLNLLVTLALACVVVLQFSNGQEKDRIIQELKTQQQAEGQKSLKVQKEEEAQKQFEAQIKLEAQKQVEAKKMRMINDDLDKIDARLKRVLDQPSGFADETKAQRDTQEELLRQLASCAKTEIGILVVEMQSLGFTNDAALQENLDTFFRNHEDKIHEERLSYDYIEMGFRDSDHKKQLDAESAKSLQAAFGAKRAIHNLKQCQKTS